MSCKTVRNWLYLNSWNQEIFVNDEKMKLHGFSFSQKKKEKDLRALSSMAILVWISHFKCLGLEGHSLTISLSSRASITLLQHEVTKKAGTYVGTGKNAKQGLMWCKSSSVCPPLIRARSGWGSGGCLLGAGVFAAFHSSELPPGPQCALALTEHQECGQIASPSAKSVARGLQVCDFQPLSDPALRWAEPQVRQGWHSLRHLWHVNILELQHFNTTKNIIIKEIQGQTRW